MICLGMCTIAWNLFGRINNAIQLNFNIIKRQEYYNCIWISLQKSPWDILVCTLQCSCRVHEVGFEWLTIEEWVYKCLWRLWQCRQEWGGINLEFAKDFQSVISPQQLNIIFKHCRYLNKSRIANVYIPCSDPSWLLVSCKCIAYCSAV